MERNLLRRDNIAMRRFLGPFPSVLFLLIQKYKFQPHFIYSRLFLYSGNGPLPEGSIIDLVGISISVHLIMLCLLHRSNVFIIADAEKKSGDGNWHSGGCHNYLSLFWYFCAHRTWDSSLGHQGSNRGASCFQLDRSKCVSCCIAYFATCLTDKLFICDRLQGSIFLKC